jgi:predicted AlkP superfamily pyrophosphatase or phosphodiesterase
VPLIASQNLFHNYLRPVFIKVNIVLILILAFSLKCKRDPEIILPPASPKKLVFVLIDGPRWEETWGDNTHQLQPYLRDSLQQYGCIFTNFYNNGITLTEPGHAALLTGHYQNIANNGTEYPINPSLAQLFLAKSKKKNGFSWLITSKDKLEVFKSCTNADWKDKFTPATDCGISGNGSGYRSDSVTLAHALQTLGSEHPDFLFIHFKEPDVSGHANDWQGYLNGIKQGDSFAWQIWKKIQSLKEYAGNTVFVITNDHGRHTTGIADGFISHGDNCIGCRHINLFIAGPGIKKGQIINSTYEQIDLHKSLCNMFGLIDTYSDGKLIQEISTR